MSAALRDLNRVCQPDVILLARGGGSIEDLWAFNDEKVVRAIVESAAPVITGVGHETDFTLADFAADLRAPTPTAAAELATPLAVLDMKAGLTEIGGVLFGRMETLLQQQRESAGWLDSRLRLYSPARRLQTERQRLDEMSRRWNAAQVHGLQFAAREIQGIGKPPAGAQSPGGIAARLCSHHKERKSGYQYFTNPDWMMRCTCASRMANLMPV